MRIAVLGGLLLVACAVVFRPAMRGDWLWRDEETVRDNAAVREATDAWSRIWIASDATGFAPVHTALLRVQWRLFGERTRGYHAASLALHALNALLLWFLLYRLGARGAWLGALLFALHPAAVQAVAWISAQQHAAALCFVLLSAIAWNEHARRPRSATLLQSAALLAFAAALLCHGAVVLFPLWLLLHAWWRGDLVRSRAWSGVLAFVGVAVVISVARAWLTPTDAATITATADPGLLERVLNSGRIAMFYLTKSLWPSNTLPVYPRWPVHAASLLGWLPIIAIIALGWSQRHGWGRHLLLGFGFFLLGILPLLGLADASELRASWVADRWLYVALPGISSLVAAAAATVVTRVPAIVRMTMIVALLLGIGALARESRGRTGMYHDATSFWGAVRDAHPDRPIGHHQIGRLLARQYRWPDAIRSLQRAIELAPTDTEYRRTLAEVLLDAGRVRDAIAQFEAIIEQQPGNAAAHGRLGEVLIRLGEFARAVTPLETATGLDPTNAEAHDLLATALFQTGRQDDGLLHLAHSQRLHPDHLKAFRLAQALAAAGQTAEAMQQLQQALQLREEFAPARAMLAALQAGER